MVNLILTIFVMTFLGGLKLMIKNNVINFISSVFITIYYVSVMLTGLLNLYYTVTFNNTVENHVNYYIFYLFSLYNFNYYISNNFFFNYYENQYALVPVQWYPYSTVYTCSATDIYFNNNNDVPRNLNEFIIVNQTLGTLNRYYNFNEFVSNLNNMLGNSGWVISNVITNDDCLIAYVRKSEAKDLGSTKTIYGNELNEFIIVNNTFGTMNLYENNEANNFFLDLNDVYIDNGWVVSIVFVQSGSLFVYVHRNTFGFSEALNVCNLNSFNLFYNGSFQSSFISIFLYITMNFFICVGRGFANSSAELSQLNITFNDLPFFLIRCIFITIPTFCLYCRNDCTFLDYVNRFCSLENSIVRLWLLFFIFVSWVNLFYGMSILFIYLFSQSPIRPNKHYSQFYPESQWNQMARDTKEIISNNDYGSYPWLNIWIIIPFNTIFNNFFLVFFIFIFVYCVLLYYSIVSFSWLISVCFSLIFILLILGYSNFQDNNLSSSYFVPGWDCFQSINNNAELLGFVVHSQRLPSQLDNSIYYFTTNNLSSFFKMVTYLDNNHYFDNFWFLSQVFLYVHLANNFYTPKTFSVNNLLLSFNYFVVGWFTNILWLSIYVFVGGNSVCNEISDMFSLLILSRLIFTSFLIALVWAYIFLFTTIYVNLLTVFFHSNYWFSFGWTIINELSNNYFAVSWFINMSFLLIYVFVGIWIFFTSSLWLLYFGLELQWMLFIIFFVLGNSVWNGLINYVIFNELIGTLLIFGLILHLNIFFSSLYYGNIGFYPFMIPMLTIISNVSYLYFIFDPLNNFLYFSSFISFQDSLQLNLMDSTKQSFSVYLFDINFGMMLMLLLNFFMIFVYGISYTHSINIILLISSLINFLLIIILIISVNSYLFVLLYFLVYYFTFFFFMSALILIFNDLELFILFFILFSMWLLGFSDIFWFIILFNLLCYLSDFISIMLSRLNFFLLNNFINQLKFYDNNNWNDLTVFDNINYYFLWYMFFVSIFPFITLAYFFNYLHNFHNNWFLFSHVCFIISYVTGFYIIFFIALIIFIIWEITG